MHVPDHASELPKHVDPIPMPDSPREAEMLVLLLDAGVYPKTLPAESGRNDQSKGTNRS
jgi:hypothetical protein